MKNRVQRVRRRKRLRKQSVSEQVGSSPDESEALTIKTELLSKIVRYAKQNYSQAELQKILGEPQPRISNLLTGKVSNFSLEKLIEYTAALKMRPEIKTSRPAEVMAAAG